MKHGQILMPLSIRGYIDMLNLSMINYFYELGYKEKAYKTIEQINKTMQGILQLYGWTCYAAYWQGIDDYDSDKQGWGATDRFNHIIKQRSIK